MLAVFSWRNYERFNTSRQRTRSTAPTSGSRTQRKNVAVPARRYTRSSQRNRSIGKAENLSAFVESAIEEKLRRTKRADLYAAYDAAATDVEFQKSMSAVAHDFAASDTDNL